MGQGYQRGAERDESDFVLHLYRMGNTLTIRLPEDLADWLEEASRNSGVPKGSIVKKELERARNESSRPFMRLAGKVDGPPDLSTRKGYSRK